MNTILYKLAIGFLLIGSQVKAHLASNEIPAREIIGTWTNTLSVPNMVNPPSRIYLDPSRNDFSHVKYKGVSHIITKIKLSADHRFLFSSHVVFSGRWEIDGARLTLKSFAPSAALTLFTDYSETSTAERPAMTLRYSALHDCFQLKFGSKQYHTLHVLDFRKTHA